MNRMSLFLWIAPQVLVAAISFFGAQSLARHRAVEHVDKREQLGASKRPAPRIAPALPGFAVTLQDTSDQEST